MLELILMAVFCGKLRELLQAKGRSAFGYQLALVGLWMFVEPVLLTLLCAAMIFTLGSAGEQLVLFAYVAAIFGALTSSLIVFAAAMAAPPSRLPPTAARGS